MNYIQFEIAKNRRIYYEKESVRPLTEAQKLIFDCDGVLTSDINSYREAIRETVDFYFFNLLCLSNQRNLVTQKDIQKLKDTGFFNNDWLLTHALIEFYLITTLKKFELEEKLEDLLKKLIDFNYTNIEKLIAKLKDVGKLFEEIGINGNELIKLKDGPSFGIEPFIAYIYKNKGRDSIKDWGKIHCKNDICSLIKKISPLDLQADDLVRRLFDEIYLGAVLFKEFHNRKPFFNFKHGLIENECIIPKKEVLKELSFNFGRFAIYSERPRMEGMFVLKKNNILEFFDAEAIYFYEDILRSIVENLNKDKLLFTKPNPEALITLVDNVFGNSSYVIYIGDTVSDAILIKNVKSKGRKNILFIGTLSSSNNKEFLLENYKKHGADAIINDVNDIPDLLVNIKNR
ncbi:MAG: hypothetical protein NWF08_07285 [Candidatus Bathyarchaeota archaeon]|nr:hypothetical protein [Candidatus Bathyarchaeota archaeon]